MRTLRLPLLAVSTLLSAAACGDVEPTSPDASDGNDGEIDAPSAFTVGGTVTGFAGSGLVLQLNGGNDLTIAADGSFAFPEPLAPGAAYAVTVAASPTCPQRLCTVTGDTGSGTVASENVTSVVVDCALPKYRLGSQNWGESSIRVTDDLAAIANNATAMPRILTGANTGLSDSELDGLAFDPQRDLIYAAAQTVTPSATTFGISAFANASTATGDVAPARRILVAGESEYQGLELDAEADRLYASAGSGRLLVFTAASTRTGTVVPNASISVPNASAITLDRTNDRLYVSTRSQTLHVFDNARELTSGSTPTRTITWTATDFPRAVAVDACNDRLYLFTRNASANGHNGYALANASTLTGAIDIEAATARMAMPDNEVMSAVIDSQGALYFWDDSATTVKIFNAPHTLSGAVAITPDKLIAGVVARGYGLDVMAY